MSENMTLTRVSITIDDGLLKACDERAKREGLNRSHYFNSILSDFIEGRSSKDNIIISSYETDNTVLQRVNELERENDALKNENSALKDVIIQAQRETISALGSTKPQILEASQDKKPGALGRFGAWLRGR
jgi:metal-responsive CopG/Arc/MetJ family transcriptional regulator